MNGFNKIAFLLGFLCCLLLITSCEVEDDKFSYGQIEADYVLDSNGEDADVESEKERDEYSLQNGKFEEERLDSFEHGEMFLISIARLNPNITQSPIDQSYWQRTSFLPEQLDRLEGVTFTLSSNQLFTAFSLGLIIENYTAKTLYYDFLGSGAVLEKFINESWHEVPLFGGAQRFLDSDSAIVAEINPFSEEWLPINLNLWRPTPDGLFRLITEVSFDCDFYNTYLLSVVFELNSKDFITPALCERVNAVEGVSLEFVNFVHELGQARFLISNHSTYHVVRLGWELEKKIGDTWYRIPINNIAPQGLFQGATIGGPTFMYSGDEEYVSPPGLQIWFPISEGVYRFLKYIIVTDVNPRDDWDYVSDLSPYVLSVEFLVAD
jgi:hypothetical protein